MSASAVAGGRARAPGCTEPQTARGRFITLEGGEGAGKSTQIRLLAAALAGQGIEVVATREPGGSAGAEAIRALLMEGGDDRWDARSEALLFAAARADHVARTIRPALNRGALGAVRPLRRSAAAPIRAGAAGSPTPTS